MGVLQAVALCRHLVSNLVLLGFLGIVGCKANGRASLENRYTKARQQLQRGFADESLQLANAGFADSSSFPDLNWKFRILTAEAVIRQSHFAQALKLLRPDPPSNSLREIFWRRRLIQGFSFCLLNNYGQAEERFSQAAALGIDDTEKAAELIYVRGRCEMSRGEWRNGKLLPPDRRAASSLRSLPEGPCFGKPWLAHSTRSAL